VRRRPRQTEQIIVRTWPRGWEKLFAIRDFDIQDDAESSVVVARSYGLIVDLEKRRPLRPQAVMDNLPRNEGRDALAEGGKALDALSGGEKAAERTGAYSDIDFNGHMNNARYVQWIQDILDPGALEQAKTMRLDINYLSEVKLGETLELWKAPLLPPNGDSPTGALAVEGRRGDQAVFRAELRLDSLG
jgi:acyl-ACP thioesterase